MKKRIINHVRKACKSCLRNLDLKDSIDGTDTTDSGREFQAGTSEFPKRCLRHSSLENLQNNFREFWARLPICPGVGERKALRMECLQGHLESYNTWRGHCGYGAALSFLILTN